MDLKEANLRRASSVSRHPWEVARLKVLKILLREHLPRLSQEPGTVLDVGCGDTFITENLSRFYPNLQFAAVDSHFNGEMMKQLEERFLKQKLPVRVFSELSEAMLEISAPLRVVLLLDVLEHIEDDEGFLKNFNPFSVIGNETVFVITAPACPFLFSSHDRFLEHFRRYTRPGLERCVLKGGFSPTHSGGFFFLLLFPRVLQVAFEKIGRLRGENQGVVRWKDRGWIDKVIVSLLVIDFKVGLFLKKLGIPLIGLSTYVIAKKSSSAKGQPQ